MKQFFIVSVCMVLFLLPSCMSTPPSPPEWKMAKDGIVLNLKADSQLNTARGKSYTLYFVVYQLTNPNSFNQLSQDREGLSKLLESRVYDTSVASVKSMVVYPGSDVTYRLDRAEGAMYVGVVAGYYTMVKEHMVRLFDIPVFVKRSSMWSLQRKQVPTTLEVNLILGPQQLDVVKKDNK